MPELTRLLRRLASDRRGAAGIEYTLIAALIGAAAIFGFDQVGQSLKAVFLNVEDGFPPPP